MLISMDIQAFLAIANLGAGLMYAFFMLGFVYMLLATAWWHNPE